MALTVFNFSQLVSNVATAMQAAASSALDFTVGSVLRAVSEATAGVVLWLQAIILQILTLTRAATSEDGDLDSWMADYGLARLAATYAAGQVTFSRFTPTLQALIPIGAAVQTSDGTQKFLVALDATNAAYNAGLGGYVLAANVSSVGVPVQAVNSGAQGNVQAGAIAVLSTSIPGVDTVTNAASYTNGIDGESDSAFRARFVLYLASLSKGTRAAVAYAIRNVQQGLSYTITENHDYDGTSDLGFITMIVDDGTGSPPSGLITSVYNAVDMVRPLTSRFAVYAPVVLIANVSMTITTAAGYTHSAVVAAVTSAIRDFINGLTLGSSLPYSQLASIAYGVPGVINATGILLNSGTSDLTADAEHKILAGSVAVA